MNLRFRKVMSFVPEFVFLIVFSALFIMDLPYVNYAPLAGVVILTVLLLWKNRILASVLSFLIALGSAYMLLAVLSEYNEMPVGLDKTKSIVVGFFIFGISLLMSTMMFVKYNFRKKVLIMRLN